MMCPYCFGSGKLTEKFIDEYHKDEEWRLWMPSGSWRLYDYYLCAKCNGTGEVEYEGSA